VAKKRQHRSRPYLGPSGPFGPPIIITDSPEPFAHPWRIAVIFDVDATTDLEAAGKGFDIADAAIVSGPEFDVVCCRVDRTERPNGPRRGGRRSALAEVFRRRGCRRPGGGRWWRPPVGVELAGVGAEHRARAG
jgi:hypothetical protein